MRIISRAEWGASPWNGSPSHVDSSERTEFYVHYDGGTHINRTGNAVPQAIEAEHLANGWAGIGYHFVVDQDGNVFEGRGWDLQGAHCPNHNRSAYGVQIAIGGDQDPSDAALAACDDLYDLACSRVGRTLSKHGHRDGFNTDCPGDKLYAWVQAGMPRPGGSPQPTPDPTPGPVLSHQQSTVDGLTYGYGTSGDHIRQVQQLLTNQGCDPQGVDGQWGDHTTAAYQAWQQKLGYSGSDADGVPGPTSMRKLLWTGDVPAFQHTLQWTGTYHGVDGAAKLWQQKMTDRTWAVNGVDGYFGPHCQELAREFQQRHGLQVDGIVGPVTWLMTWMAP